LLLGVAAIVSIASNWIRVYAVILVGHVSEMRNYLITVEHHTFGWVLFLVAMSPVLLLALRLERREGHRGATEPATSASVFPSASGRVLIAAFAAAAVLLLPRLMTQPGSASSIVATGLPAALDGAETRAPITSGWAPHFANANEDRGAFGSASLPVEVYRAVFPHQDSDHRLTRPDNDFLGAGFRLVERQRRDVQLPTGGTLELMEYRGELNGRPRVVWAWYWVAGEPAATVLEAKFAELLGLLKGRRDGSAIAIAADCVPDCVAAHDRLAEFALVHESELRWSPDSAD
jgi:EpsI family protein